MAYPFGLTTQAIRDVFSEEISAVGGTVSDTFDDGGRLFTRSVLPPVREVRYKDQMQGGVALRATEQEIRIHPYLFRQVCRNGAIIAQAIQTRQIELEALPPPDESEVIIELREAVRECCSPEVFSKNMEVMRTASEQEADFALQLLPMLSHLPQGQATRLITEIMKRFGAEKDHSALGLVNAVTSLARETSDPEIRWELEELGGGIPALLRPLPRVDDEGLEMVVSVTCSGSLEEMRRRA
jgi:hypothetical protein